MYYFGFDLGDGESCIHYSQDVSSGNVNAIPIDGNFSFLSAVGRLEGQLVVGRTVEANSAYVEDPHVCFKRHFLENKPEIDRIIRDFVCGTLRELRKNETVGKIVDDGEQACFVVGCPAGWKPEDRERYKQIMQDAGIKRVKVISESRAAFENALFSKENGISTDIKAQTVLVIDIGSSTLDFAYIKDGNEYNVETMGNVLLGGGLLDEMIVLRSLELQEKDDPENAQIIRHMIETSDSAKSRLMLDVRGIKEEYFSNESMFLDEGRSLEKNTKLFVDGRVIRVKLQISPDIVENWLISRPHPLLDNQSFESRLRNSLVQVHQKIKAEKEPDLVILTGGASRMHFFQELCKDEFLKSKLVISAEPEYDISRGLVFIGSVDENLAGCIREIREYVAGDSVEEIVQDALPNLIEVISPPITDIIMNRCVKKSFKKWQSGTLKTLYDFEDNVRTAIQQEMSSEGFSYDISKYVMPWSRNILGKVREDLTRICQKRDVGFTFNDGSLNPKPTGGKPVPIDFDFIVMINNILAVVLAIVCGMLGGGAGIALIMSGPVGVVIGVVVGLAAALVGRKPVENLIKSMNIPVLLRKAIHEKKLLSPRNVKKAEESLQLEMLNDSELKANLVRQVSQYIDTTISEKAALVERAMLL